MARQLRQPAATLRAISVLRTPSFTHLTQENKPEGGKFPHQNNNMKHLLIMFFALSTVASAQSDKFKYTEEKFADIQMLRYKVEGFEQLTLRQKTLIYYLSEAALQGRDILFDQNGRYNLRIRRMLETVFTDYKGDRKSKDFLALHDYLKRVWFSSGIHHHYGNEKFQPAFSQAFFRKALHEVAAGKLPLQQGQTVDALCDEIFPIMFDPNIMKMRTNQADGQDLILTSAGNYYGEGVTQAEAELFYEQRKAPNDPFPIMTGLNSRLVKQDGRLTELEWREHGLYGSAITKIIYNLQQARPYCETPAQQAVIDKLIEFYRTGDLRTFDEYSTLWVHATEDLVDFVNGFTETYGDPLGLKASWEAIVNFKNIAATKRTEKLSKNAQWFEDHSPVNPAFRKPKVKGVTANVICAAMLGGDEYPASAIG
ncbi:MAG: dihydrofolate reductase, partial [Alloprevotella tannerae]|nr:dihydrofolate reductase [Alloprevotella tannerae]